MDLNQDIFWFLNQAAGQSQFTDQVIYFLAEYLGWVIIGALLAWIFSTRSAKVRHRGWHIIFATLIAWVVVMLCKHVTHSDRPFMALTDAEQLVFNVETYAFPSGHSALFAALGISLNRYYRRLGPLVLGAAVLIGLARVAAGVHWPIDIVVGWAVGLGIGAGLMALLQRLDPDAR